MKSFVLYKIINTVNGKQYIGCSKRAATKFKADKKDLKANKHHNINLQRSWNRYGEESFKFEVFKEFDSEEEMFIGEIENINNSNNLYNIAAGGLGGNTRKNFTKEQARIYDENKRIQMIKWHYLQSKSPDPFSNASEERREELLKKWSDCKKGVKNNNAKYFEKVIQTDLDLNIIKIWENVYAIKEDGCYTASYVINCCNKKKGYYKHNGFLKPHLIV